ncbi:hypothetical protein QJQ45_022171 [Haematococcus lacustris]|nr:hypothetical protein QJQ45_022171 [Haematococcus lacustris]
MLVVCPRNSRARLMLQLQLMLLWVLHSVAFTPSIFATLMNTTVDGSGGRVLLWTYERQPDGSRQLVYGSICADDKFDDAAATTICRQLSLVFPGRNDEMLWDAGRAAVPGAFGRVTAADVVAMTGQSNVPAPPVLMANLSCPSNAFLLSSCTHTWRPRSTRCTHARDAGVWCYRTPPPPPAPPGGVQIAMGLLPAYLTGVIPIAPVRLATSFPFYMYGQSSGRLEVKLEQWTSVCAAGMDPAAVQVACRQLGYGSGQLMSGFFSMGVQDPAYRPITVTQVPRGLGQHPPTYQAGNMAGVD